MRQKEGFFNASGFTNVPAIQQKFKDTLPNAIFNNDPSLDLAALSATVVPSISATVSPLKNEWKQPTTPTTTAQFNTMQAECENVGNGDPFAHLSSLASSVDTSSRLRCGWVYDKENYSRGRGALGIMSGPLKTSASGTWFWDLNQAKQKYHTDICDGITNCGDIGASMYKGRCGWCKKSGKAVPVSNREAAYPYNEKTRCPSKHLATSEGQCTEGFTNPSVCTRSATGTLSRDCLLQKVVGAGCSDEGSMYQALRSGSDNDYLSQLRQQQSWSVYQSRAIAPLDETAIKSGKITIANALDNFNAVQQQAASNLNGGLQFAARDLCYTKGALDSYDFCTEINDSTTGPFNLECLQKVFLTAGGQTKGKAYPSSSTASKWNAMGTWSDVKNSIQKLLADTRSADRITQENAMVDFYGIVLEDKKTPLPAPPAPPLSVRLGQNCDSSSGWQKEVGVGDWSAGSGFPGDASYITVPEGLTAKLTNAGGQTHVVTGPGEFNFCSKSGFNDNVRNIIVTATSERSPINIVEASYGINCDSSLRGNRTSFFQSLVASGQDMTNYLYNFIKTGGDPAPGCRKTLQIDYKCENGPTKTTTVPSEAGFNGRVSLNCPPKASAISPTYVMKDFVQYTQAGTDLPNQPMSGSVNECSAVCNTDPNCKGFSWAKGVDANSKSNCWLKQNINNPTASQPYVTYVRQ